MKRKYIILFVLLILLASCKKKPEPIVNETIEYKINDELIELTEEENKVVDLLKTGDMDTNYNANVNMFKEDENHDRHNISPNLAKSKVDNNLSIEKINIVSTAKNPYYATISFKYTNTSAETISDYCLEVLLYRESNTIYGLKDCQDEIKAGETKEYKYETFSRIVDADDYEVKYHEDKAIQPVG